MEIRVRHDIAKAIAAHQAGDLARAEMSDSDSAATFGCVTTQLDRLGIAYLATASATARRK
jgi:hypothetical protein